MKEKSLLKVAFGGSIVGVVILFIFSQNVSVEEKAISKITSEDVGKKVKIKGFVENVFDSERATILEIVQAEDIKVVLFKKGNETIGIKKGNFVEVIGKVSEHEGGAEVVGQRVRVIGDVG
jgi:DNA/RNA endonuclease YhcR with UshA esterase domain